MTYIEIPRWDEFQHYKKRDPKWIKVYTRLGSKDEFRSLTMHQRGVLLSLWLEYARAHGQLRDSTLALTRQLGQRVVTRDLKALNHAGFIVFSASTLLQDVASPEGETERKEPESATTTEARPPAQVDGLGNPVADAVRDLEAFRRQRRAG